MRVVSAVGGYWSAALLGGAAVVLLVLGAPAKAALAGAGFALIGAALTRAVDVANERRTAAAQADGERRRDLDETRRLAYMVLATPALGEGRELAATLVNALAHHGLAADPRLAARHIQAIIAAGQRVTASDEGVVWLQEQIARINAELDS